MVKSKVPRARRARAARAVKPQWGSAAAATVGSTSIEVDEATNTTAWRVSIETPAVYLSWQLQDIRGLTRLRGFFIGKENTSTEFSPGVLNSVAIKILRDDETAHRFFIQIADGTSGCLRVTLSPAEAADWIAALDDVLDQLAS